MVKADPLSAWWQHKVEITQHGAEDSWGTSTTTTSTVLGYVDPSQKLVRDATGTEVVSNTTVFLPSTTGYIPPGTHVTMPAHFGGATSTVISCSVADAGTQPTPNHVALHLE